MIYITGDTHGSFERVENFCQRFNTKNDDIMIILGDAGINFSGPRYDRLKKRQLEELPITIFAIHGNHEQRPFTIESYKEQVWNGGMVYYEEEFPSILFAPARPAARQELMMIPRVMMETFSGTFCRPEIQPVAFFPVFHSE